MNQTKLNSNLNSIKIMNKFILHYDLVEAIIYKKRNNKKETIQTIVCEKNKNYKEELTSLLKNKKIEYDGIDYICPLIIK